MCPFSLSSFKADSASSGEMSYSLNSVFEKELFLFCFKTGSQYVAHVGLKLYVAKDDSELVILLTPPPMLARITPPVHRL